MKAQFKVVIPARYASQRLPGKPLLDIAGQPMILHVVQRAMQSGAAEVVVATDHAQIMQVVQAANIPVVMTRSDHVSGTDRIAEVVEQMAWAPDTLVVNVQGDEPLIDPQLIQQVAQQLWQDQQAVMATACHAIHDSAQMHNPNIVKVVLDQHSRALYFSRAPIPFARASLDPQAHADEPTLGYRHIGIYAYRAEFLQLYTQLPHSNLEKIESLEQLRVLCNGYPISVYVSQSAAATGVDTEQDLAEVRRILSHQAK